MALKLQLLLLVGIFCNADGFQTSCLAAGSRGSAFSPTQGRERSRCLTPPPAIPSASAKPRSRSVARVNARMSHKTLRTGGYLRSFRGLIAHFRQMHRRRSVPAAAGAAAAGRRRAGSLPPLPSARHNGTAARAQARTELDQLPKHQGAMLALPVLGRLLGNSANLFQVGVLLGTIPTLLAGVVCFYWAYQVIVTGSPDYQSRKLAENIKTSRLPPAKVGPGNPGFVDRPKLLDADALRQEVQSRYNPTLLVHGERGSGKTVAVRLALHSSESVVHVKLWGKDVSRPLFALAQAIIDTSSVQVTAPGSAPLVVESALRNIKGRGWKPGGASVPIVVVELDKRCSDTDLLGVLLACKRWGDDENLAKFVVEAPSARIARGLPISLSDLRVEGVKMRPLAPSEAQQVAVGCVPIAASRNWKGGRQEDLAKYIVSKVGLGMLDLVRVGFAARNARDPLALHASVNRFATRESRAARGGVKAFLVSLRTELERKGGGSVHGPGEEDIERRLWRAIEGAAARADGRGGKNPGLDEVLETIGVSERAFESAVRGVGPASPLSVDPFSYKVSIRSLFFRNALEATVVAKAKEKEGLRSGDEPVENERVAAAEPSL
ncbi:unnamed protein product [Ectocarpus sp. 6 AP-2014]